MVVKVSIELSERQVALADEQARMLGYEDLSRYIASIIEERAAYDIDGATRSRDEAPDGSWLNQEAFWKGYDEQREARNKKKNTPSEA